MNQSKIENGQPEEKLNNEQEADIIPSDQVSANAVLPAVFRQYMDELRWIFLSSKYSDKERHDLFLNKLNGISRWVDKEHENLVRHVVIFDQVAYLIPSHIYNDLMKYHTAYSQAVCNAKDDLDGYDESNDLFNYKVWIKRHYTPICLPSDNLDRAQLSPVEYRCPTCGHEKCMCYTPIGMSLPDGR